jgi:hypothetical protein
MKDNKGHGSNPRNTGVTKAARERAAINKGVDVRHFVSATPERPVAAMHASTPSLNTHDASGNAHGSPTTDSQGGKFLNPGSAAGTRMALISQAGGFK